MGAEKGWVVKSWLDDLFDLIKVYEFFNVWLGRGFRNLPSWRSGVRLFLSNYFYLFRSLLDLCPLHNLNSFWKIHKNSEPKSVLRHVTECNSLVQAINSKPESLPIHYQAYLILVSTHNFWIEPGLWFKASHMTRANAEVPVSVKSVFSDLRNSNSKSVLWILKKLEFVNVVYIIWIDGSRNVNSCFGFRICINKAILNVIFTNQGGCEINRMLFHFRTTDFIIFLLFLFYVNR